MRQHPDANIHRAEQEREAKQQFEQAEDDLQQEIAEKRSGTYVLRVVDDFNGHEEEFVFDAYNMAALKIYKYK